MKDCVRTVVHATRAWLVLGAVCAATMISGCGDETSPVEPPIDFDDVDDPDCDPLDPARCSLPWPSDLYLEEDPARITGYTLAFGETTLPANAQRRHIDPTPYRRLDGYGWGTPIMALFQDLDYDGLPSEFSLQDSLAEDSRTLLFRVTDDGLERVVHWVEQDRVAARESERVLYMRPGVILEPDTRYVVAFRDLTTTSGTRVQASDAFAALRDGVRTRDARVELRRPRFEELFTALEEAGVERASLTLAWSFHTGSEQALHHYLDEIVRLGFEATGPDGPEIELTRIEAFAHDVDHDADDLPWDPLRAYSIDGVMEVPNFLREVGARVELNLDDDGTLVQNGTRETNVVIQVPHVATSGEPVGVIVYGHGLLGGAEEARAPHLRLIAQNYGYIMVAVPLTGMSYNDYDRVVSLVSDFTNFPSIADGLHQGVLEYNLLARTSARRLEDLLRDEVDENITIDSDRVHYFGGSQGGIFGPTVMAVSPDLRRGILAVPGNNYSTMLQRSTNFAQFTSFIALAYRHGIDQGLVVSIVQQLWDTTDSVSYYRRLFASAASAPADQRHVLLLVSKGDKQVAVVTNEILARTYPEHLAVMAPYDSERVPWGVEETAYPTTGSALVMFDFGNAWPVDRANTPPEDPLPDPHPRIAEIDEAGDLIESFLDSLTVIDVCGGDGCTPR